MGCLAHVRKVAGWFPFVKFSRLGIEGCWFEFRKLWRVYTLLVFVLVFFYERGRECLLILVGELVDMLQVPGITLSLPIF